MHTTNQPVTAALRQEWRTLRSRGRILALAFAALVTILLGLLAAAGIRSSCSEGNVEVACPTDPIGPHGQAVSDQFFVAYRPLGPNGSITARMTSMTGIITYPPPDHDEIVPGLVPWAKAGLIVKDGLAQGSPYAALMVTGSHGVRMQHDYVHDTPGRPGGVSPQAPRWLRLTRSGDTITGYESTDGAHWTQVGTAHLPGLPETVQAGLFATSPGDLTLAPASLGASLAQVRFTQVSASFDHVTLSAAPDAQWRGEAVGEMGRTDWERYHRAPGLVESDGTFTVTGSGDIGPMPEHGGYAAEPSLTGLAVGLIIVIAVAARFTTHRPRPDPTRGTPLGGQALAAKAVVIGAAAFLTGLVAAGVALPLGTAVVRANGSTVPPVSTLTQLRVIIGVAALVAVAAVFALALAALLRRAGAAILVTTAAIVVPYVLAALPLLPDDTADWLLRLTPAAGFAVQQTAQEFPQVVAHYAPSAGYFPLPGWAGLAVTVAYTAALLGLAVLDCAAEPSRHHPNRPGGDNPQRGPAWRPHEQQHARQRQPGSASAAAQGGRVPSVIGPADSAAGTLPVLPPQSPGPSNPRAPAQLRVSPPGSRLGRVSVHDPCTPADPPSIACEPAETDPDDRATNAAGSRSPFDRDGRDTRSHGLSGSLHGQSDGQRQRLGGGWPVGRVRAILTTVLAGLVAALALAAPEAAQASPATGDLQSTSSPVSLDASIEEPLLATAGGSLLGMRDHAWGFSPDVRAYARFQVYSDHSKHLLVCDHDTTDRIGLAIQVDPSGPPLPITYHDQTGPGNDCWQRTIGYSVRKWRWVSVYHSGSPHESSFSWLRAPLPWADF